MKTEEIIESLLTEKPLKKLKPGKKRGVPTELNAYHNMALSGPLKKEAEAILNAATNLEDKFFSQDLPHEDKRGRLGLDMQ